MYGILQAQSHINILQKRTERDMIVPMVKPLDLGTVGTIRYPTDTRVRIQVAARFSQSKCSIITTLHSTGIDYTYHKSHLQPYIFLGGWRA